MELFDSPWTYNRDTEKTELLRKLLYPKGYSNLNAFKIEGDNGYLFTAYKDRAWEIYHFLEDFTTGDILKDQHTRKPNPRFYSTMIELANKFLNKPSSVRIIATKKFYPHYKKVIEKVIKGHPYEVDWNEPNEDPDLISVKISPKNKLFSKSDREKLKEIQKK